MTNKLTQKSVSSWRSTRDYRIWRAGVIRRDTTCQICNTIKHRHAHHIKHATYWPELRFELDNGITLCAECHSALHNKIVGSTRKKCWEVHFIRLKYIFELFQDKYTYINSHRGICAK